MIWDREKYKPAIEALGVMKWYGVDRSQEDLPSRNFEPQRHESVKGPDS